MIENRSLGELYPLQFKLLPVQVAREQWNLTGRPQASGLIPFPARAREFKSVGVWILVGSGRSYHFNCKLFIPLSVSINNQAKTAFQACPLLVEIVMTATSIPLGFPSADRPSLLKCNKETTSTLPTPLNPSSPFSPR